MGKLPQLYKTVLSAQIEYTCRGNRPGRPHVHQFLSMWQNKDSQTKSCDSTVMSGPGQRHAMRPSSQATERPTRPCREAWKRPSISKNSASASTSIVRTTGMCGRGSKSLVIKTPTHCQTPQTELYLTPWTSSLLTLTNTAEGHINTALVEWDDTLLQLQQHQVRATLCKVNERKAAAPDGVSGRVFKACTDQLVEISTTIFNLSLLQSVVPIYLKSATIVPVPKSMVSCLNDYSPIPQTPIIMKDLFFLTLKLPFLLTSTKICLHTGQTGQERVLL